MNAADPNQARQAPGAHNPDFSPENPAITWAKENKAYLAFLLLVITGIASYQHFWPRYQRDNLTGSWSLFQELTADPAHFQADRVEETLSRSRSDDRVHPWVVHAGVTNALNSGDLEALRTLRSELQVLASNEDLSGYRLVGETGPESLFAYSLAMVDRALAPEAEREFTNPAPTGTKIRFTVTVNETDAYDFEAGLYEDASPEACAAFLALLRSGRLAGQPGLRQGSFGFEFTGAVDEEAEATDLVAEREWGYFHLAGALYLTQTPGSPGQVDPNSFELGIADAPHLDGQTSVIGMVTSGVQHLEALQYLGPNVEDTVTSMILTSIEVVEGE